MHALHCVLVRFENIQKGESFDAEDVQLLVEDFRQEALDATKNHEGRVFDWRRENAGRWADDYPHCGVILGYKDPERFLNALEEWRNKPLEAALENFEWCIGRDWGWRTRQEIEAGGYTIFDNPLNGSVTIGGQFWSAVPLPLLTITPDNIRRIWDGTHELGHLVYRLVDALRPAIGEYTFDSQFYSVPDYSSRISSETLENARKHPEWYALVFLNYHY